MRAWPIIACVMLSSCGDRNEESDSAVDENCKYILGDWLSEAKNSSGQYLEHFFTISSDGEVYIMTGRRWNPETWSGSCRSGIIDAGPLGNAAYVASSDKMTFAGETYRRYGHNANAPSEKAKG